MFESAWYRCSKLSNGMPERYPTPQAMEEAALPHVLQWLGLRWVPWPGLDLVGLGKGVTHPPPGFCLN